ncbi:MAG TPA: heme lyase CcmF/NrfE family subunit [Alphaproteobacteria bacterium]|nr:heme lyase CcmF/NrfE family subunit [Alphaproteobacteria bacterium]
MIPELGQFALILALLLSIVQGTLPLIGAARGDRALMNLAPAAATGQFVVVLVAFLALMQAYVVSDFSVLNVVQNSHSAKPMLYKISGVWGNHEGSMVLWVLILAGFGWAVGRFGTNLPPTLKARVLAVQGLIALGFLAFILITSNPFERVVPAPLDGRDLNPLLQDPGLAFHPPFLYLGYVGFSIAFSFAAAALIEGRVDPAWARWVRPWTLAAWVSLTLGIALGSWWAYYELGWGGWWFWDPVENASFMPWLAGTALLHSAIVVEKRDALKSWTILLAIVTFSLSLMGTFLVRSGILTSVHAFAVDPARGTFILGLLALATGGALTLYALRAPVLKVGGLFQPLSREGSLVLNNLLLSTACATVLLGTLYPLFLDAVGGDKVSVGAPYFNATFVPIMTPLVIAMTVGPMLAWKRGDLAGALQRLHWVAGIAALAAIATWYAHRGGPVLAVFGMAVAAWAFFGAFAELVERIRLFRIPLPDSLVRAANLPLSAWGLVLGHAGMGVTVAGIVAISAWNNELVVAMQPGQTVRLAGYEFTLDGVRQLPFDAARGRNYEAQIGSVTVREDGAVVATLRPEKRWYPVAQTETTEAGIHAHGFSNVYAALGAQDAATGAWSVRLYQHPLVLLIWGGAAVMSLGGVLSLADRRLRVGAPAKRRVPAHAVPAE